MTLGEGELWFSSTACYLLPNSISLHEFLTLCVWAWTCVCVCVHFSCVPSTQRGGFGAERELEKGRWRGKILTYRYRLWELSLSFSLCMRARSLQSCLTLCNPMGCSLLSMTLFRQEYWSRLSCPPPGDLPEPGMEPVSLALPSNSLPLSHLGSSTNS